MERLCPTSFRPAEPQRGSAATDSALKVVATRNAIRMKRSLDRRSGRSAGSVPFVCSAEQQDQEEGEGVHQDAKYTKKIGP